MLYFDVIPLFCFHHLLYTIYCSMILPMYRQIVLKLINIYIHYLFFFKVEENDLFNR